MSLMNRYLLDINILACSIGNRSLSGLKTHSQRSVRPGIFGPVKINGR
jgi:hypothetical protein